MTGERFTEVLKRIDALNAADPEAETDGAEAQPAALLYGQRMSAELVRFCGEASEHLRIAVRGQHIERWKLARAAYPEGREGYLTWRRDQGLKHAERVAGLMRDAGYGQGDCDRVALIIRKEGIKRDAEVQVLEDVAALVFLRWYCAGFAEGRAAAASLDLPAGLAPALEV